MKNWLFPLMLLMGVCCHAEEFQTASSVLGTSVPNGMFSANTYIAKNTTSTPLKHMGIKKTSKRCQIWGEYADNFVAYIWGMTWCCSPSGTMCEGIDKGQGGYKFYFDKLTESQSLTDPTVKTITSIPTTPKKSLLCPNKWVRVTFDGNFRLFQYRPSSTLEFTVGGNFSEKPGIWMRRLCDFDAEKLFEGPRNDSDSDSESTSAATAKQHNSDPKETAPAASTSAAKTTGRANAPAPAGAIYLFGNYFYTQDVPDTLSTVRFLQTADKQQELKINFSGGDKSAFLQKLQKRFAKEHSKITYCDNNNILFETQQEVYQAFVLAPNAITVLARPSGFPADKQLRDELCDFSAVEVWLTERYLK